MTRHAPNQRMLQAAHVITHHTAARFTEALALIGRVEQCAADCSPGEKVHSSGVVSPVEREVMVRYEARTRLEDLRDHLNDWLNTGRLFGDEIEHVIGWAHRMLGTTPEPLTIVHLCGDPDRAKTYEGRQLAWVPMSRNPENGWHDATCRDIAGPTGLCDRCRVRMNGWRERHNLPTIGVQQAAA